MRPLAYPSQAAELTVHDAGSGLTTKQRSLVISCMALLCYLALGSLVFSLINSPRLTFQDALYFTVRRLAPPLPRVRLTRWPAQIVTVLVLSRSRFSLAQVV